MSDTNKAVDWSMFDVAPIHTVKAQPSPNLFLDAALFYARKGWRITPLQPKSKIPIQGLNGANSGTTDEKQIQLWWDNYEDANVGISTGRGLLVVDVDSYKGGDDSLAALEEANGELPETYEVLTGRGGRQLYFSYSPTTKLGLTQNKLGAFIDTRADGGYVVAPPSIHPDTGKPYVWEVSHHPEEATIAEAPQWLVDLLTVPAAEQPAARAVEPSTAAEACRTALHAAATRYIGKTPPAVQGDAGDAATFKLAGHVASFVCRHDSRLTPNEITDLLDKHYNPKCSPPWTQAELQIKVYSALSNGTPRKNHDVDCTKNKPATWDGPGIDVSGLVSFYEPSKMKNIKWLWGHRIPLGAAVVISGGQGHGKSTMLYDIIARLSVGADFPDGQPSQRCKTLILSAEDNPEDSAGPKLEAAGADHTMIKKWPVDFTMAHLEQLDRILELDPSIKLVMIEPLYEIISGDMNSDTKNVTQTIGKLQRVAQVREVAIIGVHHFGKAKADNANAKNIGSMGFTAKARACWGIVPSKSDPQVRIFAPSKNNVNLTKTALQFRIETTFVDGPGGEQIETAKVAWLAERLETSLDDLLSEQVNGKRTTEDIGLWLTGYLNNGKVLGKTVLDDGKAAGYSRDQIYSASERIGVKKHKDGFSGGWLWILPKVPAAKVGGSWEEDAFASS